MRSLLGSHMVHCESRPAEVTDAGVAGEVDRIMASVEDPEPPAC